MRMEHEEAYPGIAFRPWTRNWLSRLAQRPAECIHLEYEAAWRAALLPDTLYLRGRASIRRRPARPGVLLCRECLLQVLRTELAGFPGRVVAFEPDGEVFTQYFYVAQPDFERAGLMPEVSDALARRVNLPSDSGGKCDLCQHGATWTWLSREEVGSLDDHGHILAARGVRLCAQHGAATLCEALEKIPDANVYYINLPYGEAGTYVWI
jgi:hypothetical protein